MIKIITNNNKVYLYSDYTPELPSKAKMIGGRWNSAEKAWVFSLRDLDLVKKLSNEVYGWDDDPLHDIRLRIGDAQGLDTRDFESFDGSAPNALRIKGRLIAQRKERDAAVQLGNDVLLIQGEFADSGGSRVNPRVFDSVCENMILEIRNCYQGLLDALPSDCYEIVEKKADINKEALQAERERLLARLAEIEQLLQNEN